MTQFELLTYDRKRADDALEHRFFVLKSHDPLYYGEDIDWTYNPMGEDEMRWQLHRRYWFSSLCRMYAATRFVSYSETDGVEHLVLANSPYEGLEHERSFDFHAGRLVITDRVWGNASGKLAIHYQFRPDSYLSFDEDGVLIRDSGYKDVRIKVSSPSGIVPGSPEEGWVSFLYGERFPREAYAFEQNKAKGEDVTFITEIKLLN